MIFNDEYILKGVCQPPTSRSHLAASAVNTMPCFEVDPLMNPFAQALQRASHILVIPNSKISIYSSLDLLRWWFFYPMQVNPRFGILPLFVVFEWITEQDHTLVITLIKSKVGFGVCTRHIWAPRWKRSAWCLQHLMPGGKAIHAPKSYWFLSSLDCWPACSGATRCTPSMARPVFWRPSHILVPINPAWSTEKGNQIKEFRPKKW